MGFGASDHSIGICDTQTLKVLLLVPKVHGFPPTTIAFSHDSALVVSGSADNTVHIIQLPEKFNSGTVHIIYIYLFLLVIIFIIIFTFRSISTCFDFNWNFDSFLCYFLPTLSYRVEGMFYN